jgi:hypothetical protein
VPIPDIVAVALARGMLNDPRRPWHAAAQLGASTVAPPQYWRSQPAMEKALLGATVSGARVEDFTASCQRF